MNVTGWIYTNQRWLQCRWTVTLTGPLLSVPSVTDKMSHAVVLKYRLTLLPSFLGEKMEWKKRAHPYPDCIQFRGQALIKPCGFCFSLEDERESNFL